MADGIINESSSSLTRCTLLPSKIAAALLLVPKSIPIPNWLLVVLLDLPDSC